MSCCQSCEKGAGGDDATGWRRIEPIGDLISGGEIPVASDFALPGDAQFGVWFELEHGSPADVACKLALSASEVTVSQTYELGECNTVRVEFVTFILSSIDVAGTKIAIVTLESSIDRQNWRPESQTPISAAGFASWAVRGISGRFVRIRYLGGSDNSFKSVHAVTLTGTHGRRWSGRQSGAV